MAQRVVIVFIILFSGFSEVFLECYIFTNIQPDTEVIEVESSEVFIPAAAPSNVTVVASSYQHSKHLLQLNISWHSNKDGQRASSFNIHAWSLNESDPYCGTEPYYAYVEHPDSTFWVIPPKTMDETTHHISSFLTLPGCSYRIRLEANPHNGKIYTQVDYTVPDCVENICSCRHSKTLPKPELKVDQISENIVSICWSMNDLTNISSIILRAGPKLLDGSHSSVYNLSWRVEKPASLQMVHEQYTAQEPGQYAATVTVVDLNHCLGPEHQIVFTVENYSEAHDNNLLTNTKIYILLIFFVLLGSLLGRKCVYWFEYKRQTAINLKHRVFYKAIRVKSEKVFRRGNSLQERNILYVEKEIEEARAKGEADGFEISYNQLTFMREIGHGAFGRVFLAKAEAIQGVPGPRLVAVKKLKVSANPDEREEFLDEIAMLKRVGQHPNVVSLVACCTLKSDICMVMEYVPYGDLLKYLRSLRQKLDARKASVTSADTLYSNPSTIMTSLGSHTYSTRQSQDISNLDLAIDHTELQKFALQIAKGMAHLEDKRITHRDLAARNILMDKNKVLKISDFGLSRRGVYVNTRRRKVPLRWLSIEAIRDSLYSSKSDVWAFAIVLWEIGTLGGFPYPTVTDFDLLRYLEKGNRLEKPDIVSENLYSMMLMCWSEIPDERPSFAELVSNLQPDPNRHIYVDISSNPKLPPTHGWTTMVSPPSSPY